MLLRAPYLGVSCRRANSIACDRVGLAVWLRKPATAVAARVDGRPLRLRRGRRGPGGATYWQGFLQPAGLLNGPLAVTPDRGRFHWEGSHPKDAWVKLTVERPDGSQRSGSLTIPLRAGWG